MSGRIIAVVVVALVSAGAAVLVGLGQISGPIGLSAIAVGVLAGLGTALSTTVGELFKQLATAGIGLRAEFRRARLSGAIVQRKIEGLDPVVDLGVHPALRAGHQSVIPSYVARAVDPQLDRLIASGGMIVVEGDSAVGKTRSAYEALKRASRFDRKRRKVIVPRDGDALRKAVESGYPIRNQVVWLDDLERFVSSTGLDTGLLRAILHHQNSGSVVLCTLRSKARRDLGVASDDSQPMMGDSLRGMAKLLSGASIVRVSGHLDEQEQRRAAMVDDERVSDALRGIVHGVGFAEHLAAGPAAVERVKSGEGGENRYGAALVRAAIDLRRAGYLQPVPEEWLHVAAPAYVDERWHVQLVDQVCADGLGWARMSVYGASPCLQLVSGNRYRVFDYLVDQAESEILILPPEDRPRAIKESLSSIPGDVWHLLLEKVSFEDPQFLGCLAAAERAGHPGMFVAFTEAVRAGQLDPTELATGERLLALSMTCMRVGYCAACYLTALGLDPRPLLNEIVDRLRPFFGGRAAGRYRPGNMEALMAADFLAHDGAVARPESVMGAVAAELDAVLAYELSQLLQREERPQSSRAWLEVAASNGHVRAQALIADLPPLEPEIGVGVQSPVLNMGPGIRAMQRSFQPDITPDIDA